MEVIVGERSVFRARWAVHAFKDGHILPLTPKYFDFQDSKMQLLEMVRARIDSDPAFAVRFYGHLLIPVNVNDCIIVNTIPKPQPALAEVSR